MQAFQIPKPSGIPPAGKRPGVPGRPGAQPGARPGLPKPKNPVVAGGKPMVPITSLMQFVPKFPTEEEEAENKEKLENGISMPENNEQENKGEDGIETNAQNKIEDQINLSRGDNLASPGRSAGLKEHEKSPLNGKLEDQHSNLLEINGHQDVKDQDNDPETRINEVKSATQKVEKIQDPEDVSFGNRETDQQNFDLPPQSKLMEVEEQLLQNNGNKSTEEEDDEKPPVLFSQKEHHEEDNLKVNTKTENTSAGLGVKSPFGNPFMKKAAQSPNPNLSIRKEDIEEAERLNQSPSPLMHHKNIEEQEGRSTQDEQRDLHSDPSSGLSRDAKYKDGLDEVVEECSPMVTQDSNLLFKLKMLEVELEKEKKEKSILRGEHEKLVQENIEIRYQLSESNLKLQGISKQGGAEKDLLRKDEEIRRLKAELKSTMEGSRLVTEHSNRVISESAKFKEETGLLLASLEKEKEELHQSFIDYKRQIQQEYISKLASMQDQVVHLQEKVKEYEGDLERHHGDLKNKSHTVHKLAQINNDLQSTLDYWPSFKPIIVEIEVPVYQDNELVNTKSPILEASRVKEDVDQDQVLLNDEIEPAVVDEPQEEVIEIALEPQNIKEDEVAIETEEKVQVNEQEEQQAEEGIAMEINVDMGVQEEEQYVEENQQEQEIEPIDNQWGVEEPLIVDIGVDIEDKPQESLEEAESRKNIDEVIPTFEPSQPQPEEETYVQEESHNHPEPVVDIQPEEPKITVDSFTAPPVYRMPQKKKNGSSQPKKPAAFGFAPPAFVQNDLEEVQQQVQEPEVQEQNQVTEESPVQIQESPVQEPPKMSEDAFTAPPAYRMPQKKKNVASQPKKPAAFGFTPPAFVQNDLEEVQQQVQVQEPEIQVPEIQEQNQVIEESPVQIQESPVEEPPKISSDGFTAPPAYRMPQKKKNGPPQPKKPVGGFGFAPAPMQFQAQEEPVVAQIEDAENQPQIAVVDEEEKPPMMNSPPKMNTPFGRPPVQQMNKASPVKRFVPIEKAQPLQNEQNVPNGHVENDEHIDFDKTSHTSLEHSEVTDRTNGIASQDEIDIQRPSQGSINNSGGRGKLVASKAIKKKKPGQGSIYS